MKPGATYRDTITITNKDNLVGHYSVHTADWVLSPEGAPVFSDALAPDSCRPWVAIEQHDISLSPGASSRFRFEITPPAGQVPRECRFAIILESAAETVKSGAVSVPLSGRLGVIVYARLGDAAPKTTILEAKTRVLEGRSQPVLVVRNTGTAHDRLEGFLDATDASGRKWSFEPSSLPIMPGETREVLLTTTPEDGVAPFSWTLPLKLKGRLDSDGGHFDIDETVAGG